MDSVLVGIENVVIMWLMSPLAHRYWPTRSFSCTVFLNVLGNQTALWPTLTSHSYSQPISVGVKIFYIIFQDWN